MYIQLKLHLIRLNKRNTSIYIRTLMRALVGLGLFQNPLCVTH